jgi:hypothetical protein
MKTAIRVIFISVCSASLCSTATASQPGDCRIVRDGARVELQWPFFVLGLDTQAGLRANGWESRLTGQRVSLGDGPELEAELGDRLTLAECRMPVPRTLLSEKCRAMTFREAVVR